MPPKKVRVACPANEILYEQLEVWYKEAMESQSYQRFNLKKVSIIHLLFDDSTGESYNPTR